MNAGTPTNKIRRALAALLAAAGAAITGCATPEPIAEPFPDGTPRLVLFIVIDQMTQDYLVRYRPLLTGGFGWLLDNGVVFGDAHHNHAHTVTAAGHATLASGCFPSTSGMVNNSWRDRSTGATVYCVVDREHGRSPANLLVSSFGDWLKERDPAAKVFAAGGKDRSAVLLGGHQADGAFWYSAQSGDWVTSSYYEEPDWLDDFNDFGIPDTFFGETWEPLPVDEAMLEQLEVTTLDEGVYQRQFPYPIGGKTLAPNSGFYGAFFNTPFADDYLLALVEEMIEQEELGADLHPDYLGVAFHTLDSVGHSYGPHSRELVDALMRLDRVVGGLLKIADERVGLDNVVIALSADHGVVPLPEYRDLLGLEGERIDVDDIACFQRAGRELGKRYGEYDWLLRGLYLNERAIERSGIDRATIEREVADFLGSCEGVARVWTRTELMSEEPGGSHDPTNRYRELFRNSYHPERSGDFEILYEPYYLNRASRGTSHGTPYEYDTWVPVIIVAPGVAAAEVGERIITADVAPTLAAVLGLETPAGLDGTDRSSLLGRTDR